MKNLTLVFAIILFALSCKTKVKVDAIYFNGIIITVDSAFTQAEAFAVKEGKFIAIGKTAELLENYEAKEKIDLLQKFVYPGFIDAHCHFMGYAGDLYKCQLRGTTSFDAVLEKLVEYDKIENPGFLYGRGWDQNDWEHQAFPNNKKLNLLFPDKPVFLKRIDGHAVLVNAKFLALAVQELKPYLNSEFVEMKEGIPTGILFDKAMDAAASLIPELSVTTLTKEIIKAQEDCFKLGLTSLSDAGLSPQQISLIDSLQKADILKLRIYAMVSASSQNLDYFETKGKIKTPYLNVQSFKVYVDGALGSRGARLKNEYSDMHQHFGAFNTTFDELEHYAKWAFQHQFQLCSHAIGDSANALVLELYSRYLNGENDLRWRIEHAQVVDKKDIHLFGANSIVASVQPTHATSDMYWAQSRLGEARMGEAYAYKSLLHENGWLPLGTDFPVEYLNPQYTFYAAVSRKDGENYPQNGFQMNEALTREEALRGITIWAARSNFEEKEKGSIEVGKYADFLIYDIDFLKEELLKIRNSMPLNTFLNGDKVFEKK